MTESEKRILCVGMCVLDVIHVCIEFPEEGTNKRTGTGYWQRGGNASNICTVLRNLRVKCEFLGMTSSSPAFAFLLEDCRQRGIDIHNCPTIDMDPPFSSIILIHSTGSRTIIHSNRGFPALTLEHFKKIDLSSYLWIHFEGGNIEETKEMINAVRDYNQEAAKRTHITISVELKKPNSDLFALAIRSHVVFVGKDLAQHQGWSSAKETVYAARNLIRNIQAEQSCDETTVWPVATIISHWGSESTDCLTAFNEYESFPSEKVPVVVDSLGAGDTFVAGFIHAMKYLKLNELDAVKYATEVAAFKIQYRGYDKILSFEPKK